MLILMMRQDVEYHKIRTIATACLDRTGEETNKSLKNYLEALFPYSREDDIKDRMRAGLFKEIDMGPIRITVPRQENPIKLRSKLLRSRELMDANEKLRGNKIG